MSWTIFRDCPAAVTAMARQMINTLPAPTPESLPGAVSAVLRDLGRVLQQSGAPVGVQAAVNNTAGTVAR